MCVCAVPCVRVCVCVCVCVCGVRRRKTEVCLFSPRLTTDWGTSGRISVPSPFLLRSFSVPSPCEPTTTRVTRERPRHTHTSHTHTYTHVCVCAVPCVAREAMTLSNRRRRSSDDER